MNFKGNTTLGIPLYTYKVPTRPHQFFKKKSCLMDDVVSVRHSHTRELLKNKIKSGGNLKSTHTVLVNAVCIYTPLGKGKIIIIKICGRFSSFFSRSVFTSPANQPPTCVTCVCVDRKEKEKRYRGWRVDHPSRPKEVNLSIFSLYSEYIYFSISPPYY
jgi:hypothetical protein